MISVKAICVCGESMNVSTYYTDNELYSSELECKCGIKVQVDYEHERYKEIPTRLEGSD